MSETLGEKLRKARENRGISISQVSEQTRIASHFLLAIEENDFSVLPGGIFNKGFVRSYAKCVGVNEQEALADYNALMASFEPVKDPDELYTPEVLTDEKTGPSMVSTVVLIVLILAVLIGGLIVAIYWVSDDEETPNAANAKPVAVKEAASPAAVAQPEQTPEPESFSVEISAKDKIIEFNIEVDGDKSMKVIKPGEAPLSLQVKQSFKGNFYRSVVPAVALKIKGQDVCLSKPSGPYLTVAVTKDLLPEVLSGKCYGEAETAPQEPTPAANRPTGFVAVPPQNTNPSNRPAANRPATNRPANRPSTGRPAASPATRN